MESDLAAAALAGLATRRVLAVAVVRGGRIVWASPALLAMFGLEPQAGEEPRLLDLVLPADREAMEGIRLRSTKTVERAQIEVQGQMLRRSNRFLLRHDGRHGIRSGHR